MTFNIRFPNQMIEQVLVALEQKGPGISQPGHWKPCRRRLTSKREHIHQLKVMKDRHYRVLPSERDDIVNSLNCRGIAVIGLQVSHT